MMNTFDIILGVVLIIVVSLLIIKNKNKIKLAIQERIEKNTVKISNLKWVDKRGREHTETILIKRSRIPLIGDWGRVYLPMNEEGKIKWFYAITGGKKNFIKLMILLVLVAIIFLGFYEIFNQYLSLKELCEPALSMRLNP